jgi:hypothetical protein
LAIEFRRRLLLFLLDYTFVILPNPALVLAVDVETPNGTDAFVVTQFGASQKVTLSFQVAQHLLLGPPQRQGRGGESTKIQPSGELTRKSK